MGDTKSRTTILVTGGGGFVGSALVRRLVALDYQVASFSRSDYPELKKLGVKTIRGDLTNFSDVRSATKGCQVVIHSAAKAGYWGSSDSYHRTNKVGTDNIIRACQENEVGKLIYTSTASVVFGGQRIENGGQDLNYSQRPLNAYCRTKALAEQSVLAANGVKLRTISLRPHIVTGPGDRHLVPRLIDRAQKGRLRIIGDGNNLIDTVFIDNLVDAHLLAIRALDERPICHGKAYFITNGEPVNLWGFINQILAGAGLPLVTKHIPYRLALPLSSIISVFHKLIPALGDPMLTPFLVKEMARSHWFDPEPARRDLGYSPSITTKDGLKILIESLANK